MTSLFVGLYGLYLVLVGVRGNAQALIADLNSDAPNYLPWLIAIVVLAVMSEFETTKPIVKPIAVLLVMNFILRNFVTVKKEFSTIYNLGVSK